MACGDAVGSGRDDVAGSSPDAGTLDASDAHPTSNSGDGGVSRPHGGCPHWDCFFNRECVDGRVIEFSTALIPCESWTGSCPSYVAGECADGCSDRPPSFGWRPPEYLNPFGIWVTAPGQCGAKKASLRASAMPALTMRTASRPRRSPRAAPRISTASIARVLRRLHRCSRQMYIRPARSTSKRWPPTRHGSWRTPAVSRDGASWSPTGSQVASPRLRRSLRGRLGLPRLHAVLVPRLRGRLPRGQLRSPRAALSLSDPCSERARSAR